ncbi:hypothetical protein SLITO_v1c09540 [Spiroplasma litorale]|uniref:Transmembrane protein n=1 Tax=Spiroplasma litorale TaxID=216942 RepID=A0A0K1W2K7_9MOLU|nr:hypothetical protein [Spiroplasma litorale]AKX34565.1 hypothetical protein SLITO_v1c09540 [Spiroplasma litorale]
MPLLLLWFVISLFYDKVIYFNNSILILFTSIACSIIFILIGLLLDYSNKSNKLKIIKAQFNNKDYQNLYRDVFNKFCKKDTFKFINLNFENNKTKKDIKIAIEFIYKNQTGVYKIEKPNKFYNKHNLVKENFAGGNDYGIVFAMLLLISIFIKNKYTCKESIFLKNPNYYESFKDLKFIKNIYSNDIKFYENGIESDSFSQKQNSNQNFKQEIFNNIKNFEDTYSYELIYSEKIALSRNKVYKKVPLNQIGILNYKKIKSFKGFIKEVQKKLTIDLDNLNNLLNLVAGI